MRGRMFIWRHEGDEAELVHSYPVEVADEEDAWKKACLLEANEDVEIPNFGKFDSRIESASCFIEQVNR
jgi:hypothetical protein